LYEHDDVGLVDVFSYHIVTVSADAAYFDVISDKIFKEMITAGSASSN